MLSRKHYKAIAQVIKDNSEMVKDTICNVDGVLSIMIDRDKLIQELCIIFKQDNNLFNSDTFKNACE